MCYRFIIHVGDSVFTTAKTGIYTLHALSPCSEIKMTGCYIINICLWEMLWVSIGGVVYIPRIPTHSIPHRPT